MDQKVLVSIEADQAYVNPSDQGQFPVYTTSNSTSFTKISANSQSVSDVRFDVPVGKTNALSRNMRMFFKCKFLCQANTPLPANDGANDIPLTAASWKTHMGDFADISFAPSGILSICDSISVEFAGRNISIKSPSTQLQTLLTCANRYTMDKSLSGCMLKPDLTYNYVTEESTKDLEVVEVGTNEIRYIRKNNISANSPFSGCGESEWGSRLPPYKLEVIPNDRTKFYMYCTLETFIPCNLLNSNKKGFNLFGLEKLSIILSLRQTYGRLFSMIKSSATSAFQVQRMEFTDAPELHTIIYTPPEPIMKGMLDQDGTVKPYLIGFNYFDEVANTIVPDKVEGATTKTGWSYNSISCPCLPKRLYIGMISNMDEPYIVPDGDTSVNRETLISCKSRSFARIDRCILSINGTRSLVSASARDMYRMSVENGLNLSEEEALYTGGAPIVVDLRKDCSLAGMLVGNSDAINIGVDLDFTNLDPKNANRFKLYVLAEYDSVLNQEKGIFTVMYTNVAANLVGQSMGDIKTRESGFVSRQGIYLGGGFWGTIGDGLKWFGQNALPVVKTGVDIVRTLRGGKNETVGGATLRDSRFK